MSRKQRPYIVVFWEGESEEVYLKFLKQEFRRETEINVSKQKGLFDQAIKIFGPKGELKDSDVRKMVDEIWFIFDTEKDLKGKWNEYEEKIGILKKRAKNAQIKLLMTKGCIEYYFLLHFEKSAPTIILPVDKDKVEEKLKNKYCSDYKKGDKKSTYRIAKNYIRAIENSKWSLKRIEAEIVDLKESRERNRKLFVSDSTFSNAHEGVEYLLRLKEERISTS